MFKIRFFDLLCKMLYNIFVTINFYIKVLWCFSEAERIIMVKYNREVAITQICRKCAGKHSTIKNSAERQATVMAEFGQIGANCPPNYKGEFTCPYHK